MIYCDPETGTCEVGSEGNSSSYDNHSKLDNTLLYFGDPMCSWCWGIAPEVDLLKEHYSETLDFKLIMGGLRPGGGDPWYENMKQFLRNHWEHVQEKSGQPFSFELLDRDDFNYDTEPPCRAVKTAESFNEKIALPFYHDIQHRFYAENEDPGNVEFYRPLCEQHEIPFEKFSERFDSETFKNRTFKDFEFSRHLGVSAFPTVLISHRDQLEIVAYGYTPFQQMKERIERQLSDTMKK